VRFASFHGLEIDDGRRSACSLRLTCLGHVIAMVALEEAGFRGSSALVKSRGLDLSRQVLGPAIGKSKTKMRTRRLGFEYRNDFYPDVDDTAFVLMHSAREIPIPSAWKQRYGAAFSGCSACRTATAMGAFDGDNNKAFPANIPFADHNAMIDPSTADVYGRACSNAWAARLAADHPAVQRGLKFLLQDQCETVPGLARWRQLCLRHERACCARSKRFPSRQRNIASAPALAAHRAEGDGSSANPCAAMRSLRPRGKAIAPPRKPRGALSDCLPA